VKNREAKPDPAKNMPRIEMKILMNESCWNIKKIPRMVSNAPKRVESIKWRLRKTILH
jgi:hypothetical protein